MGEILDRFDELISPIDPRVDSPSPHWHDEAAWIRARIADLETRCAELIRSRECPIKPGLYRIHWRTGGSSLAAVGVDRNGARWLAPINWVSPFVPETSRTNPWLDVESYDRIDHDTVAKKEGQ